MNTLKQFYDLMARTRAVRAELVPAILNGQPPAAEMVVDLSDVLRLLEKIPGGRVELSPGRHIGLDLGYETSELRKDLIYLRNGPKALREHLAEFHRGIDFSAEVARCTEAIGPRPLNAFVTDRDGTVNNYCARYLSSVQSVHNAVLLTLFARERTRSATIITSGPLSGPGILDLVTEPPGTFIYGASKGREYLGLDGVRRSHPIDPARSAKIEELNRRVERLVSRPEREKFALIGSGFQVKFGQTTVARQDITGSVDADESVGFLREVESLVRDLDPDGELFVIEDTGLDIEIILTHDGDASRDFDKGDGLKFLEAELDLRLDQGGNLVAGDTASDLPMLEAALERSRDTRAAFVTRKAELAARVRAFDHGAVIVPEPDVLVAALGTLAGAFD